MATTTEQTQTASKKDQGSAKFRHVLKNRRFLLLWLAQLISLTILNAANFGIIVLVNNLTHSVFMAGLAIVAFTLPAVPFSALAGVLVDRLNKRIVLWVSNILRALTMLLLVISLLVSPTSLWPIYILTFMTSLIGQFFTPAEGATIPLLVGEKDLMPALSLFNITMTVSQAVGFLLLGSLVTKLFPSFTLHLGTVAVNVQSVDTLFALVFLLYLVCAGLILCIPPRAFYEEHIKNKEREHENENDSHKSLGKTIHELWVEVVEGWRIVRKDSLLYFSVIQLSVVGVIMLLIGELAGTFVQQVLHHPPADMAIILAPAAIGLVGASVLMPRITERVGKMRLTVIGFIGLASGFVLLPLLQGLALRLDPTHGAESPFLLGAVMLLVFLLGVAMASVNIPTQTTMQEHAPEEVRGRIFSLQFMLYNTGSIPILLFAGVFAQFLGLNLLIFLIAASMLLFCWWGTRFLKTDKTGNQKV